MNPKNTYIDTSENWKQTRLPGKSSEHWGRGWCRGNWRGVERREKGKLERAWGSGMVEIEEGRIWEQGRRYLN